MFFIFIINIALSFSMPLYANIFSNSSEEKKEEATTASAPEPESSEQKETRAGAVFGRSPGKITTSSESTEKSKSEATTVFGKNSSNQESTESSSGTCRASSVFGTHRCPSGESQTSNADEKDGYSKERIADDDNPRSAPNYMWPVDGGKIVSFYGWRSSRKFHDGIDIKADSGTKVFAAKSGEVIYSDHKIRGYGNMIVIRHNASFSTVYAHNKVNLVSKGDVVQQGDLIANVGSTGHSSGPHLHFEVRKGKYSADPLKYLSSRDVKKHSGAYENSPDNPSF